MAGLFDGDPTGGLMAAFANPQTAGLLGMAGGLLQAAGPSRIPVSMGQAFGAGLQGMGQGAGNAMQMRMQMAKMQAQLDPFGTGFGSSQVQQPNPTLAQGAPVYGAANSGPMSGVSAGLGSAAPQMPVQQGAPANGLSLFAGHSPQEVMFAGARLAAFGNPAGAEMMKIAAQADPSLSPTDITKMGVQGGMSPADIQAANAAGVAKANYIPPVNARPGAILRNPLTMQPMAFNPNIPAGGTPVFDASGNVVGINQIPGAADITSAMAAAKTAGEGSALPFTEGKDASGNPLPIMSRTAAATQGAGVPGFTPFQNAIRQVETNGNMNAVNPASGAAGSMQVTKTGAGSQNPGFGVRPAANNSPAELQRVGADYAGAMQQHYGNDTDAAVAYNWGPQNADKWIAAGRPWKMLPPETRNYVGQVHAQMQNFSGNGQGGAIYAAAPMGATTAANASQGAPSEQMAHAYGSLSNSDANYQQSREALQQMMAIARNQGIGGTVARMLPQDVATRLSTDAAEYQKAHANYVSLQGKALGGGGTDASRATINESVPTYDKPQDAKIAGLTNQLNQLDQSHLKAQFLTPLYTQGNEKAYTQQSAAFDQNIKPSMMPILQMTGDQQRAAVQAAVKANPSLRANFEWAFNNGMLK